MTQDTKQNNPGAGGIILARLAEMNTKIDGIVAAVEAINGTLTMVNISLTRLEAAMTELDKAMRRAPQSAQPTSAGGSAGIASPAEIRGKYGNPQIRFNPNRWTGESYKGRTAADCEPDFLDMYADSLEYFAGKNEEKGDDKSLKDAKYDRIRARLCRRWAIEMREGRFPSQQAVQQEMSGVAPANAEPDPFANENDIPF